MILKKCLICNREFNLICVKSYNQKYCSNLCRELSIKNSKKKYYLSEKGKLNYILNKKEKVTYKKNCFICDTIFITFNKKKIYCSIYCNQKNYSLSLKGKNTRKLWEKNNPEKANFWRDNNPEKFAENKKKYNFTEKGKLIKSNSAKKYKLKFPEKRYAIDLFQKDRKKNPRKYKNYCEICNSIKHLEYHHEDYSKPYQVICLCHLCHSLRHKRLMIKKSIDIVTKCKHLYISKFK